MNNLNAIVAAVALAVASTVINADGRSNRQPNANKYSIRSTTWATVQDDPKYEGWFKTNLRCSKTNFEIINQRIEDKWLEIHEPLHWNVDYA